MPRNCTMPSAQLLLAASAFAASQPFSLEAWLQEQEQSYPPSMQGQLEQFTLHLRCVCFPRSGERLLAAALG